MTSVKGLFSLCCTVSNNTAVLKLYVITRGVGTVGAAGAHATADFREGTFVHPRSKFVPMSLSILCTRSSKIVPTPLTMYDFHNSTDTLKF